MYKHIYGPIPSRRLGISLGIDLVPYKTCTLDCIYCECGKTNHLTLERKEYIPTDEVIAELRDFLSNHPQPDYLTLSGSGEPTLNSGIGRLISTVKSEFPESRFAVLTNSTLLHDEDVQNELLNADLIVPSLDAARSAVFTAIDRPHPKLCGDEEIKALIDSIAVFTQRFHESGEEKQVWLESLILEGVNDSDADADAFRAAFEKIKADKFQLNTLDRPGTVQALKPASHALLEAFAKKIGIANVEVVSKYRSRKEIRGYRKNNEELILESISRRPLTVEDLCEMLHLHQHEVFQYLDVLKNENKVKAEIQSRGIFYRSKV